MSGEGEDGDAVKNGWVPTSVWANVGHRTANGDMYYLYYLVQDFELDGRDRYRVRLRRPHSLGPGDLYSTRYVPLAEARTRKLHDWAKATAAEIVESLRGDRPQPAGETDQAEEAEPVDAYPDSTPAPAPAPKLDRLRELLGSALFPCDPGHVPERTTQAETRWAALRKSGATDADLQSAIAKEFQRFTQQEQLRAGFRVQGGGGFPRLWAGADVKGPADLKDEALVSAARELLAIPYPEERAAKPEPDSGGPGKPKKPKTTKAKTARP